VPTSGQAGVYGAVLHYLKAMAAGRNRGWRQGHRSDARFANHDFMTKNGRLREDGRVMRDMYLFEVKKPAESKSPFDYYKQLATVPAEEGLSPAKRQRVPPHQALRREKLLL